MHHCSPVTLGWCSKLGSLCPSLEEGRQPLQEWLGNRKISNAPPKIAAIPQHRAWRYYLDKSRREQQHMVNCLMPSGIFPAVFEELRSNCCFEGLSSEPIYNHAEFSGSQGGVDGTQHLPGTSPLSQKRVFKGLKVHSGAKARDSKRKGRKVQFGARQMCFPSFTVDVAHWHQESAWELGVPPSSSPRHPRAIAWTA